MHSNKYITANKTTTTDTNFDYTLMDKHKHTLTVSYTQKHREQRQEVCI